ncbi:MAG TPA: hypothetical protein VM425_10595 [Myxococcota bacterium]|nr:hypothetical protein [Myxococcota bacterium]
MITEKPGRLSLSRAFLLPALAGLLLSACGSDKAGSKCGDCSTLDGPCSQGACNEDTRECFADAINEGTDCSDGDKCTLDDSCQAGQCVGTPMECTEQVSECVAGVCDKGECTYPARPDGTACISKTDECNDGQCLAGECSAVVKADQTPCNDGDWCTTPDSCAAGVCDGTARNCSDGLDCTSDSCDPDRNACGYQVAADNCLIAGNCFADGDPNPDNSCQECAAAMNQQDWFNDDSNACDDGNLCTDPDGCTDGVCSGTPVSGCCLADGDCGDGKDCTTDVCNTADGTCTNGVDAGYCLIGDLCVTDGTLNPANACQSCIAVTNQTGWADNNDPCDDGLYCTTDDHCGGGSCQGTSGTICDDGVDCTDDVCNESAQSCSHAPSAGQCLIGGTCFAAGALNPNNDCQECIPAGSQTDWSADDSNTCDDGNNCTDSDHCSAGTCTGTPIPNCCTSDAECNDNLDCTSDSCTLATGACTNSVNAGQCLIAGACYANGIPNPNNNCQACAAGTVQDTWSPANEGAECGGICQACQGGTCANMPDTGDADPFGECPPCRVCDGSGGCRNAQNGTDPKNDCQAAECVFDVCQAGSCNMTSGTQCTDSDQGDCNDAQCNSLGTCLQDFAYEASGYACDDADACTTPDQCDTLGQCAGAALAPDPDPDSVVSATSACLTYSTNSRTVVSVALNDTGGTPIGAATVTIEADDAGISWSGPVVESAVAPGVYFRVMQTPAAQIPGDDTVVSVSAHSGSGACQSSEEAMNTTATIVFAAQTAAGAAAGTGGCPIDNNLRVRVIDARDSSPIAGAYVMVGLAPGDVFEDDFEQVLSGAASLTNAGRADTGGMIEFEDQGTALDGPQIVTAGFDNMSYTSMVDVDAADIVISLTPISAIPAMAKIAGSVTGLPIVSYDDIVNAAMVINQFNMDSLVKFRFDDLLAQEEDCWLAASIFLLGDQWASMPANIDVPQQTERYIFPVTINPHFYQTVPLEVGSVDQHIVALGGTVPFGDIVNILMNGGSLAGLVNLLSVDRIGLITRNQISGNENNVSIAADTALNANISCAISNKPVSLSGSDDLCLTLGDWDGTLGDGPMFIMGFRALSGGSGMLSNVPGSGAFSGIGRLGMAVLAYLDSSTLPGGDEWKSGATSGILDRSGSLSPSGGALDFDNDFLEITPLNRSGRSFQWNQVSTANTQAHFSEHDIDLIESTTTWIGSECDDVTEDVWRNTYWRILAPAGTTSFNLPNLPAGWPRAADGGLAAPGADERFNWSFSALHMQPLSASFDFNHFDFAAALGLATHTSSNSTDF